MVLLRPEGADRSEDVILINVVVRRDDDQFANVRHHGTRGEVLLRERRVFRRRFW